MRPFAALVSTVFALTFLGTAFAVPANRELEQVFVAASPTDDVGPRACQTVYPSFIKPLYKAYPDYSAPNQIPIGRHFEVSNRGGDSRIDSLLMFSGIPSNAYACQLEWEIPAGYPIKLLGHSQLYVYTTKRDAKPLDTWNNSPKEDSQWGTANLAQGGKAVVNSRVCHTQLTFRIEIGQDGGSTNMGDVGFIQNSGFPFAGWRLTHSC
ncbi:hypothetical protein GP486_005675 [Trichoglossum hirsutum]|uniref:Ubiquitin 3 binding protein But2 C-terminal domain-containing protein n=1 Tax=Trichoglossum hirsutum TaxID=265104 RepID=A0A9P8L8S7_9PEZI|nr:hypothetical protein GP486_005675 [Trichoglossum hirsutum]